MQTYSHPSSRRNRGEEIDEEAEVEGEGDGEDRRREDESAMGSGASALPPSYQERRDIAPPDYRDALQDMVVRESVRLPPFDPQQVSRQWEGEEEVVYDMTH